MGNSDACLAILNPAGEYITAVLHRTKSKEYVLFGAENLIEENKKAIFIYSSFF